MMLKYCFILFFCTSVTAYFAQNTGKHYDVIDGDEHFSHNNFLMALPIYKEVLKTDKNNTSLHYKIAECYLNTNINRTEAIAHLEFCSKDPKIESDVWLKLGKAYRLVNKIDESIKAFEKYKQLEPKRKKEVDREIEVCYNAKTFMKHPVNVSFTNMGKDINSEYADYYPWINANEDFLAFTTRRKGPTSNRVESDGYYASDVYISKLDKGKWTKAETAGPKINSALDEQVVGMKADGSELLIYIDHIDKYGDIYSSVKKNGAYLKYLPLSEEINKKVEHSATISLDGNTLFFVRAESKDEQTDIYMCRKLPNGNWGVPFKLGAEINTTYHEDFPYLSPDGFTLYFSSEGHNSMGGFDLFKSTWDPEQNTWTPAENLGYPVNTTDDDRSICFTSDYRVAYISALRPGGQGDLDIYRIKFKDIDQKMTVYVGRVALADSTQSHKETVMNMTAINTNNQEEYSFIPDPMTGKFVMALPAGIYNITITADGYHELKDKMVVSDLGLPVSEEKKQYVLIKK